MFAAEAPTRSGGQLAPSQLGLTECGLTLYEPATVHAPIIQILVP